jgi:hypothetical protein
LISSAWMVSGGRLTVESVMMATFDIRSPFILGTCHLKHWDLQLVTCL